MSNKFKRSMGLINEILLICILLLLLSGSVALGANKSYQGTDDLVDKKMQQATGVGAKAPLIDISKGNLGLFVFGVGGFSAGLIVGYYWRKIFAEKEGSQ